MKLNLIRYGKYARITVGFVYVLSGLLKLLDPVGTGLIIEAYFKFFICQISTLDAKIIGVVLGGVETIVGLAAVFGIWKFIMLGLIMGMQICFTIVSLVLVIYNPNMHCGCFGEVIHLTHWQTLIKNVFLLIILYLAILGFNRVKHHIGYKQKRSFYFSIVLMITLGAYSWFNLPIIDFTVYKPGTELVSRQNLPMLKMKDSNLYPDFSDDKWAIVSVYDLSMDMSVWRKIVDHFEMNEEMGYNVILLFSATEEKVNNMYKDLHTCFDITDEVLDKMRRASFLTDRTTAITLNRRNSGVTYINDGVIIEKK